MKHIMFFIIALAGSVSHAQGYSHSDALKFVDAKLQEFESTVSLPEEPTNVDWVKSKLKAMVKADQYIRSDWSQIADQFQLTDIERDMFHRGMGLRWSAIDAWNLAYLKNILDHHDWIRISKFGEEADLHAWLLTQHADLDWDFQSKMLPVIEEMVKLKESNPARFAYLHDRVARAYNRPSKTKPQKFGTQGFCNDSGKWEPFELEAPIRVDEFRAEYGLEPLVEYKKKFNCSK